MVEVQTTCFRNERNEHIGAKRSFSSCPLRGERHTSSIGMKAIFSTFLLGSFVFWPIAQVLARLQLRLWVVIFVWTVVCPHENVGAQEVYTVLPGDTFSRIARSHGMSLTTLLEANPSSSESLQPGDQIQIPALIDFPDLVASSEWGAVDSLMNHKVQVGDTWFGISRRYNVSLDELRQANPSRTESLPEGAFIRIPGKPALRSQSAWDANRNELLRKSGQTTQQESAAMNPMESNEFQDSLGGAKTIWNMGKRNGLGVGPKRIRPANLETDTLHLLAMLPYLLPTDTVEGGDYDGKTKRLREIALEFTHGIQWGSHLLQEAGFHVRLRLVDTEPDSLDVVGWSQEDLEWADVVFGPLRKSLLDSVANLLAPMEKPQWILTESRNQWNQYPHALLMDANREAGMEKLGRFVAQEHKNDTVIVLETMGKDARLEKAFIDGFHAENGNEGLIVWPATSQFAEGLTTLLDTSKLNVIAIPSGSSARSMMAYVQTELQLADSFPVKLYANPQSLSYEFLEWNFVNRVHWTLPSDNWLQRGDSVFWRKSEWYIQEFETEPSNYALRGCDAVLETARWTKPKGRVVPVEVQRKFEWVENRDLDKFENEAWKIIEFLEGDWKEVGMLNKKRLRFR